MSTKTTTKGNKNTEVVLGASALKLEQAVKSILGAVEEISTLDSRAAECTLKVSELEDKIGGLKTTLANDQAQNKLDLELQFKADRKAFAEAWLLANNFTYIAVDELKDLKNKLSVATTQNDAAISKAVASATGALTAKHEADLKMKELEYQTNEATNLASIKQLNSEVTMWKNQAEQWQKALDSEREARIQVSKNSAVTQNFGAANGK